MDDGPHAVQRRPKPVRLFERSDAVLETEPISHGREAGAVPPRQDRPEAARHRLPHDQRARVARRPVDQERIGEPTLSCRRSAAPWYRPRALMSRFPLRSAYAGPIVVAGAANASFVARARFDGWIVFTSWPRTDAAALLPPELDLAPGAGAPAEHPVAFVLGEQRECAFLVGGFPVATGARYQEFGMMIPFVR